MRGLTLSVPKDKPPSEASSAGCPELHCFWSSAVTEASPDALSQLVFAGGARALRPWKLRPGDAGAVGPWHPQLHTTFCHLDFREADRCPGVSSHSWAMALHLSPPRSQTNSFYWARTRSHSIPSPLLAPHFLPLFDFSVCVYVCVCIP